jgi:hypothetical protein
MRSSRKLLLVLGLFGVGFVVPALAQQPSASSYPPACEESRVTKADRERAHTVFLSGKQFLEEANYDKAISYFKDAYTIDCSVHGILPAIASAYERKGDRREAVRALEEYQKRAPNASDHEVIERRIKNLKDQIAQEQPTATASAAAPSFAPSPSAAPPASASAEAANASAAAPANPPPPPEAAGHSAAAWVLVGIGAAAIVGGGVLFGVGAGDISSAESACPGRVNCKQSVADQGNTGRTLEPIGFAVGGVGVAAVVAGLVWHFTESPSFSGALSGTRVRVHPVVTPAYAGMSLGASF